MEDAEEVVEGMTQFRWFQSNHVHGAVAAHCWAPVWQQARLGASCLRAWVWMGAEQV